MVVDVEEEGEGEEEEGVFKANTVNVTPGEGVCNPKTLLKPKTPNPKP